MIPIYAKPAFHDLTKESPIIPICHIDNGVLTEFEQSLMTIQRLAAEMRAEVRDMKE